MDITRCLTISMSHIRERTSHLLAAEPRTNKMGLSVYAKGDYGYWIYTGFIGGDVPDDLMACINLAIENECEWLCVDSDGEEIENLPTYEWE